VQSNCSIEGRNLGKINYLSQQGYWDSCSDGHTIPLERGDEIEYLQYRAEGTCFIRRSGYVFDIDHCPWLAENDQLVLTIEPVAESWIQVVDDQREPIGWLHVQDRVAYEGSRKF